MSSPSDLTSDLQRVANNCLARKIRQSSRVITAIYDEALRAHGLKVSQFNILVAIGVSGEATPAELQHHLALEKSTLSRNAERMVAKGWLESRKVDGERGVHYRLARKGRGLVERAMPDWKAAEVVARKRLGKERVGHLDSLVHGLIPGH